MEQGVMLEIGRLAQWRAAAQEGRRADRGQRFPALHHQLHGFRRIAEAVAGRDAEIESAPAEIGVTAHQAQGDAHVGVALEEGRQVRDEPSAGECRGRRHPQLLLAQRDLTGHPCDPLERGGELGQQRPARGRQLDECARIGGAARPSAAG